MTRIPSLTTSKTARSTVPRKIRSSAARCQETFAIFPTQPRQLQQQLALARIQIHRDFHIQMNIQIPAPGSLQTPHPQAFKLDNPVGLGTGFDRDFT